MSETGSVTERRKVECKLCGRPITVNKKTNKLRLHRDLDNRDCDGGNVLVETP